MAEFFHPTRNSPPGAIVAKRADSKIARWSKETKTLTSGQAQACRRYSPESRKIYRSRETHTWPFYKNLYVGKGSIGGTVTLRNRTESDLDGLNLHWFKPASLTRKAYPKGWEPGIKVDVVGSFYARPLATAKVSVFPGLKPEDSALGNALVTLSDSILSPVLHGKISSYRGSIQSSARL